MGSDNEPTSQGVGLPHAEIKRRFLLLKSILGGPELRSYVGVGLSVDQTCDVRSVKINRKTFRKRERNHEQ